VPNASRTNVFADNGQIPQSSSQDFRHWFLAFTMGESEEPQRTQSSCAGVRLTTSPDFFCERHTHQARAPEANRGRAQRL